ncbi:hypothetical protein [Isoptericola dokdonensis]|uniref:Uncharacterized protein n=1 Tax=Isoptericola dokdonensis DS-3 TaxID=1300344 RepID=A0A161I981_9MICO|nr:hypothetical protein [Isoptericola dokdonensis]ANC32468.1 hypothetical protein I598_2951 [Isoptericola dokdonensis DS-3]
MADRTTIAVATPPGGWLAPWPNVAEIAGALPHTAWTLVGGLMTQFHTIHHGLDVVRPTNDVDIVLHVETTRGLPAKAARALESLGYRMLTSIDPRERTAHRFVRGTDRIDLVTSDVVDVLVADHAAPSVVELIRGHDLVAIEGGTQALRRTVNADLVIDECRTTISVPNVFGALILKAAAYRTDSRNPERHLQDAAALLCCLDDPFAIRETFAGSDRQRIATLTRKLPDDSRYWNAIPGEARREGQAALRILTN